MANKDLLFKPVSLGPPLAKSQKMGDLGVLAEFVITRLCGHFWSRRLRPKVVRCWHFKRILMKLSCDLRKGDFQAPKVDLLFGPVSLGPPLAKSKKMGDLGVLAEFVITRLCGHFWSRRLRPKVVRCWHFKRILMTWSCNLRKGDFQAPKVDLLFGPVSLGPPLAKSQKMGDLGVLAEFVITRLCGHFWSRRLRPKVVRCWHFKRILMTLSCDLRKGDFQAPKVDLLFGPVSLGPPLAKSQKMGDLGVLAEFVITRLCGHFWSRRLRPKVVRCWHFKRILMKLSCNLRKGDFQAPKVDLLFKPVSLGPPLAKSQKMGDLGVLAEFVITRLCGHFWSRRLRPKVVRCWHFKRILMKLSCDLRKGDFQAPKVDLLFGPVSLGPPLSKISENGRFRRPCGICHNSTLRALLELPFAPKGCPMLAL